MEEQTFTISNTTWKNRAELSIAHGALTNSKRPSCLVKGVYPTHLTRGLGAYVWDDSGTRYIDYVCGLGSSLLGYAHDEVNQAMSYQMGQGSVLSLGTTLEVQAAERVKELFPFIDRLRFLKTGSDACTAAVRIARAKTGRKVVLSEGYHGFHDEFVSLTPPAIGVNDYPFIGKLERIDRLIDVAAVIVEPFNLDAGHTRVEWLRRLRDACNASGTVLIFDEIITGLRVPGLSVTRYSSVEPDLVCFGKAIANGMPLSIVGGKKEVMECGEYFISSTFAGETLSLAAMMKVLSLVQNKYLVDKLWQEGQKFKDQFNSIAPNIVSLRGYATRSVFEGSILNKALFWQEACRAGILFGPSWFIGHQHMGMTDSVMNICRDIFRRIEMGAVKLLGELPESPFAAKARK